MMMKLKQNAQQKNYNKSIKKLETKISQNFFWKPSFDILIDDKSFSFRKNWLENFSKNLNNSKI